MTTSRDTIPYGDSCDCGCVTPNPRLTRRLQGTWTSGRAGLVPRIWA